jgi:hypothetical protein
MVPDGSAGAARPGRYRLARSTGNTVNRDLLLGDKCRDGHRASKAKERCGGGGLRRRGWHSASASLGSDRHAVGAEVDHDGPVTIGSEHARTRVGETFERRSGRMAVWIAGSGRCDRDPRSNGIDERLGRRSPAAMVRNLEQVDPREAGRKKLRVDLLLDVAHEQKAVANDLAR